MITNLTASELRVFEDRVALAFNSGQIRAPVHLYSGNEEEMIRVFSEVEPDDWVLCSWRSHFQCLLKGVPMETVFQEILEGRSISLCFPEYKIFSSAIVGGVLPIATGIAMALKRSGANAKVHCFLGDMTAETGIAHECIKYSTNFDLPVRFIVEDNRQSVCTDTRHAWGTDKLTFVESDNPKIEYYRYTNSYPHAGAGVRVQF